MSESLHCYIYKSPRKPETYLFVLKENDFSAVPEPLLEALGEIEKVIDIELRLPYTNSLNQNNVHSESLI